MGDTNCREEGGFEQWELCLTTIKFLRIFKIFVCQEFQYKQKANNICQISIQCVHTRVHQRGGYRLWGGGGSVEQWPSCLTNQPCMDTQNTLKHRTNKNNKTYFSFQDPVTTHYILVPPKMFFIFFN